MFLLLTFTNDHTTNLKITSRIILLNVTGLIRSLTMTITCDVDLIIHNALPGAPNIIHLLLYLESLKNHFLLPHTLIYTSPDMDKGSCDYTHAWNKFFS